MVSKCIVCGKVFEAKNAKGVLCSSACRTKSSRMRKKSNNVSGVILPDDEVEFLLLCDGTKLSATRENVQRYFGSWFSDALGSVVDTKPSIKDAGKMSMLRGLMMRPLLLILWLLILLSVLIRIMRIGYLGCMRVGMIIRSMIGMSWRSLLWGMFYWMLLSEGG